MYTDGYSFVYQNFQTVCGSSARNGATATAFVDRGQSVIIVLENRDHGHVNEPLGFLIQAQWWPETKFAIAGSVLAAMAPLERIAEP